MPKAILVMFAFIASIQILFSQTSEKAIKGILDLRKHEWAKDGIADLNGEWEFYRKAFYSPADLNGSSKISSEQYSNVPEFWNSLMPGSGLLKGLDYATYRLKVLCPSATDSLALKILTVSTAYRLFVNGKEIIQVGKTGTSSTTSVPEYRPVVLPVYTDDDELDIVFQVSNFDYRAGGLWDFIKLGPVSDVTQYHQRNLVRDYFVTGGFFMMGLYHLVIFFFFRRRYSPLYLGILCFIICIRILSTGEMGLNNLISLPWHIIIRLEFISMFLIMTFSVLFVYHLFRIEFSKRVLSFFVICSLACTTLGVVASPLVISFLNAPFDLLLVLCSLYGIYISFNALKNKRAGAKFYLASFIVLFAALVNEILYSYLIIETGNYFYVGLFLFILLQAASLSKQFTVTFHKLNATNKILQKTNSELITKNSTIIEKNEELSKLNKELDSFVYRVTHDLRAPITSVLGIIDIAKDEKDTSALNDYFEMQRKTLVRLDNIIRDIIDYSKNNRIETEFTVVNFRQIIDNVFEDHQYMNNALRINKNVEINETNSFISDARRLYILFNNLISNAIKYSRQNIPDPFINIKVKVNTQQAEIDISDNGLGIEAKHLDKIFSMFYRATSKEHGTGLGLYIVKEVVAKLHGSISVESVPVKGTLFKIIIPNNRAAVLKVGE